MRFVTQTWGNSPRRTSPRCATFHDPFAEASMPPLSTTTDHPLRPDGAHRRDRHRPFISPVRLAMQSGLGLDLRRDRLSIDARRLPLKAWYSRSPSELSPFLPASRPGAGRSRHEATRPRPRWRRWSCSPDWSRQSCHSRFLTIESILLSGSAKIDGRFGWSTPEGLRISSGTGCHARSPRWVGRRCTPGRRSS